MSTKACDLFDDFGEALDAAEAQARTGWEMDFMADIRERFDRYGEEMYLSEKQASIIRRIGGDDGH